MERTEAKRSPYFGCRFARRIVTFRIQLLSIDHELRVLGVRNPSNDVLALLPAVQGPML